MAWYLGNDLEVVPGQVAVAAGVDAFVDAVERALRHPPGAPTPLPRELTWEARVDAIVGALEPWVAR